MKIKSFIFSLQGRAIVITTLFVVLFMSIGGYIILSREKTLYLKEKENQARTLIETAGTNFTNAILYQEVGLIEETGVIDHYIFDLLRKEGSILTVIIFDNSGMVIAHCHLFEHGKFYSNAREIIETPITTVREAKDTGRGPILEAITPLLVGTKRIATLRVEFSLKNFYEKLAQLRRRIVFMTVGVISGSVFLIVLGINTMTKPLRKLARNMDSIEYGRYGREDFQEEEREDEIAHLQRSFSSMIRRLKEADIKWENTFNSITDLLSIQSRDYRIVKVNKAFAQRLNMSPEALVGRYCWEVYHNSTVLCPNCPQADTLKAGKPSTKEKEYHPLGGIFLSTTYPYFNEEGKIVGTVHIAKDITAEKRLQEKLFQSEKLAAMGQIAPGIAHEINNPLNSILSYASYLMETLSDAGGKDELERIVKAAARCRDIVKRFLNFSRETPKKMEPMDIKELMEEVLAMCYPNLSSQKIKFTKEIGTELWILGERRQIEEVLLNITLNACQAMDRGGELTLRAYKEKGWIKIEIVDTGCGIPEEDLPRIFDPFFTTKPPGKGTGLGLAVSHTIIKNHGGTIDCQSTVEVGTTFTVNLPEYEIMPLPEESGHVI